MPDDELDDTAAGGASDDLDSAGGAGSDTGADDSTDLAAEAERLKAEARKWEALAKKHRARAEGAISADELAALRDKARQYDDLAAASRTEHERALDEARTTAAAEAEVRVRDRFTARLVRSEFAAATTGRLDRDGLDELLDGINLARFVGEDGDVDSERVRAFVDRVVPEPKVGEQRKPADLGQGKRPAPPKERPGSLGAAVVGHYQTTRQ